jgi:hypothetical protein
MFDSTIEVPITIRDPDRPLGTHVLTAVARAGTGLRWTAVTIDRGDDATNALDRITIPQDVLDRIAPTALPRSSITISDEPLHRETNYRTEFVVVLNNQPQGGIANRPRSPVVRVASPDFWGNFFGFNQQNGWDSQYGNAPRRDGNASRRGGPSYDQRQNGWYQQRDDRYYYQRQQGSW